MKNMQLALIYANQLITMTLTRNKLDHISGPPECVDGHVMWHVDRISGVDAQDDIADAHSTVIGGGAAIDNFSHENRRIVLHMWIIAAAGDTEAQTLSAFFQNDVLEFPFFGILDATVCLQKRIEYSHCKSVEMKIK
uniref:Uncharacterized protein n=1 Tax=Romanomermis culicivorax TaxID=13658 RepID=A0A915HF19_ROMCU